MKVTLLNYTKVDNLDIPLKHISFTFLIDEISRACLQEISRSRSLSLTVKSSRYTLHKDLKQETEFIVCKYNGFKSKNMYDYERASKYIILSGITKVDESRVKQLEILRTLVSDNNISDDITKYSIPECYYTKLVMTIAYKDLIHLCKLRLHKSALNKYRLLMKEIIKVVPKGFNKTFIKLEDELTKDIK